MAFNFQAYRNPYVSTIAELLSRGEDAKAKGLTDVANAQARAAEIRGQAFGGAAESVGKIASKALTDYTTEKQNAPIRAAEVEHRKALGEQDTFAAGQRARTLASQSRGDTAAQIYNDAINGGSSSPQPADVDGTNRPPSAAGQDTHPYIIKVNGASLYDVDKFQRANAAAGVAVEGAPFVEEMQKQNEFRKRTQSEAQVRAQAQAGLLLGMPDDQLMQHAPAAVAALRGLYNDDALNAFMDIHGTGDVARVRQALGQLAGAKYDKAVVPGATMQSQFGDTRKNPGTPAVKMEGNPVSMLENGKPVDVVRVSTPDGGNAFQHVDGSPVTGTLTGVPEFEYVTRNGRVMSIQKGTRMPTDTQAAAPEAPRPNIWVNRGGVPMRIPEGAYRQGDTPVTDRSMRNASSVDANRIAEFDTSLDDVTVLRGVLGNTGSMAKIGAALPSWVTEMTGGWGADAKSRNAVIARVKQVIGKALEGGVLRKEDEEKYKDILPTIGDTKSVAENKINGLESAIAQRKSRLLDSLDDAGFDMSKYRARPARPMGVVVVTAPDNTKHEFATQALADEFKRQIGMN